MCEKRLNRASPRGDSVGAGLLDTAGPSEATQNDARLTQQGSVALHLQFVKWQQTNGAIQTNLSQVHRRKLEHVREYAFE